MAEPTTDERRPRPGAAPWGRGAPGRASDGEELQAERPETSELDAETIARRDAALRHVRKFGDPVLRARALPVERFDEDLRAEVERMGS